MALTALAYIRTAGFERAGVGMAMLAIPSTSEELVDAWDKSGIDYRRQLIEFLITSIVVSPATSRRPAFDATRLRAKLHY